MKKCCEKSYDEGHEDGLDEGEQYCSHEIEELRKFLKEAIPFLKRSRMPGASDLRKRMAKELLMEEAL